MTLIDQTSVKTILCSAWWADAQFKARVNKMSMDDARNTVIVNLTKYTNGSVGLYQSCDNPRLIGALGVCIFLHYMGHSDEKLGETSADDHRNTIIVYVNENGNESIPHLQGLPDVTLVDKACSLAGFDSITVKLEKTDEEAIMERIDYENMSVGDSVVVYKPMDSSVWEQMDPKLEIRTLGVVTKVTVTKNLTGPSFDTTARAAVFQFNNNSDISNGSVDMSILSTKAGMTSNQTYAGFDASANLMEATAGPIDAKLGVGVSTGIGLKDDSLGVKVGGTGFTVGRKMGISVMDNEFSVDFGKLFFGW